MYVQGQAISSWFNKCFFFLKSNLNMDYDLLYILLFDDSGNNDLSYGTLDTKEALDKFILDTNEIRINK